MVLASRLGSHLQPSQAHLGGSSRILFKTSRYHLRGGDYFSCWRYDRQTEYSSCTHDRPQGTPTILLGLLCLLMLPDRPESTSFLTETERRIAVSRMNRGTRGDVGEVVRRSNIHRSHTIFHDLTDAQVTSLRLSRTGGQVYPTSVTQLSDICHRST
jgi:hypothetical protein